jgi:transposase
MIGCDLHDRSMLLRFSIGKSEPEQKSFGNDFGGRDKMIGFLKKLAAKHKIDRSIFVYEASGQGFGLCDLLYAHGIECHVLSPTAIPTTPKQKKTKTDAKDAQVLLELVRSFVLAGNPLPVVWTPPQRLRDDRELIRRRIEAADSTTRIKLQILSMLKRRGVEKPRWYSGTWSRRWLAWLRELANQFDQCVGPVLQSYIACFELYRDEVTQLEKHIRALAKTPRYAAAYQELCKMSGVGLLTAMTFLTEMGDLTRFSNRQQVGAYLGLCPASFESGEKSNRKGHITRQGPSRLRRMLCQAVWTAIGRDAEVTAAYERIKGGKKDRTKKAIVALMRKLGIKMWHRALAHGVAEELRGRGGPENMASARIGTATVEIVGDGSSPQEQSPAFFSAAPPSQGEVAAAEKMLPGRSTASMTT